MNTKALLFYLQLNIIEVICEIIELIKSKEKHLDALQIICGCLRGQSPAVDYFKTAVHIERGI